MYYIFTDGAASKNGQKDQVGGWGYVIVDENGNEIHRDYGGEKGRTNNWGELTAAANALDYAFHELHEKIYDERDRFCIDETQWIVYTDSAYLLRCRDEGWYIKWSVNGWLNSKKEPVANRDLWERLIPYFGHPFFEFKKVKAHNGGESFISKWNEVADKLAVQGRMEAEHD